MVFQKRKLENYLVCFPFETQLYAAVLVVIANAYFPLYTFDMAFVFSLKHLLPLFP